MNIFISNIVFLGSFYYSYSKMQISKRASILNFLKNSINDSRNIKMEIRGNKEKRNFDLFDRQGCQLYVLIDTAKGRRIT